MAQAIVEELARIPMAPSLAATLGRAASYAEAQSHSAVSLEHLLLALAEDPDADVVLQASGIDLSRLAVDISQHLAVNGGGVTEGTTAGGVTPDLRRVLEAAAAAAQRGKRRQINGAIVLAAIVGDGRSAAAQMLRAQGLTFEEAIKALQKATQVQQKRAAEKAAEAPQPPPPTVAPVVAPAAVAPPVPMPPPSAPPESAPSMTAVDAAHTVPPPPPPLPRAAPPPPPPPPVVIAPTTTTAAAEPASPIPASPIPASPPPAAAQARPAATPPPAADAVAAEHPAPDEPLANTRPKPAKEAAKEPEKERGKQKAAAPPPALPSEASARPATPLPTAVLPAANATFGRPASVIQPVDVPAGPPTPSAPPAAGDAKPAARPAAAAPPPVPPPIPVAEAPEAAKPAARPVEAKSARNPQQPSETAAPKPAPQTTQLPPARPPAFPTPDPDRWRERERTLESLTREAQAATAASMPAAQPPVDRRPPPPSPARHPSVHPLPPRDPHPMPARSHAPPPPVGAVAPPVLEHVQLPPKPARAPAAEQGRKRRRAEGGATGQLVENIPRAMRVAVPVKVEVRLARGQPDQLAHGMDAQAPVHSHDITVTRAMSVRLRAPDGGFLIDAASPETQWVDGPDIPDSETFASWRWTVLPQRRGSGRLQLVVSARTVGADGLTADTALPEQVIDVAVRTNYARTLLKVGGWAAAAAAGALIQALATPGAESLVGSWTRLISGG